MQRPRPLAPGRRSACGGVAGERRPRCAGARGTAVGAASQNAVAHGAARPGWRSGRSASGRRGMATSSAACAGSSGGGGRPNQASGTGADALPDCRRIGARVSQMPRMLALAEARLELQGAGDLDQLAAQRARPRLQQPRGLHGRGWSRRRRHGRRAAHCARRAPSASGSTPGCSQKRRSSVAISRSRKSRRDVGRGRAEAARRRRGRAAAPGCGRCGRGPRCRWLRRRERSGGIERGREPRRRGRGARRGKRVLTPARPPAARAARRAMVIPRAAPSIRPVFCRAKIAGRYMSDEPAPGSSNCPGVTARSRTAMRKLGLRPSSAPAPRRSGRRRRAAPRSRSARRARACPAPRPPPSRPAISHPAGRPCSSSGAVVLAVSARPSSSSTKTVFCSQLVEVQRRRRRGRRTCG